MIQLALINSPGASLGEIKCVRARSADDLVSTGASKSIEGKLRRSIRLHGCATQRDVRFGSPTPLFYNRGKLFAAYAYVFANEKILFFPESVLLASDKQSGRDDNVSLYYREFT